MSDYSPVQPGVNTTHPGSRASPATHCRLGLTCGRGLLSLTDLCGRGLLSSTDLCGRGLLSSTRSPSVAIPRTWNSTWVANPALSRRLSLELAFGLNPRLRVGLSLGVTAALAAGLGSSVNLGLRPDLSYEFTAGFAFQLTPELDSRLTAKLALGFSFYVILELASTFTFGVNPGVTPRVQSQLQP